MKASKTYKAKLHKLDGRSSLPKIYDMHNVDVIELTSRRIERTRNKDAHIRALKAIRRGIRDLQPDSALPGVSTLLGHLRSTESSLVASVSTLSRSS